MTRIITGRLVFVMTIVFLVSVVPIAQEAPGALDTSGPVYVSKPVVPTLSRPFRDLPDFTPDPNLFGLEMKRREDYGFIPIEYPHEPKVDPLVKVQQQRALNTANDSAFGTLIYNYDGQSSTVSPPDTTGDVGPGYFLQATNQSVSTVAFIKKSTGAFTTKTLQSLATSSPCSKGYCDPVVIYDRAADRWILSELPSTTGDVCVYVSTSGDPLGTYQAYTFVVESSGTDYPKYGVWPQNGNGGSYLLGVNASSKSGYWDLFALDRAKMLAGQPATFQKFQVPYLANAGFQLVLPSHMEGSVPPPNGEPAIFARPHDDENADSPAGNTPNYDWIDLFALTVDWTTPANSHLDTLAPPHISDYDMTLCGMGNTWNCMPQPGTTQKIDPIREPLHFPLHYRNLGDYQSLVGTFVEDVDGTDHAALRWFELRKPESGGSWSLYQEGVLGGEAGIHRSVGSISMDGMGNIAIGYTRTGASTPYYPSIKYSGRQLSDALGTMPSYDLNIVDGSYSKTGDERWGDYSGMAVDPSDDCTFWFTTEYMTSNSTCGTKVAAFQFGACTTLSLMSTEMADFCPLGMAGSGDGIIDPGETVTVNAKLRNGLQNVLTGINATLSTATPGITVINSSATYADMGARAVASNDAPSFSFLVDPAVPFGTAINLNLHVTALSGGGPFDIPITYHVGQYIPGTNETGAQSVTPLTASNSTSTASFSPAFAAASADAATVAYTPGYTGVPVTLFGPDDMASLGNWTTSGTVTIQSAAHCSPHSDNMARLAGTSSSITLSKAVSTVGYTNIHVLFDAGLSSTSSSPVLKMDWYDGATWTTAYTSPVTTTWSCSNDIALPAGAEGKPGFKIRFTFTNTSTTRYGRIDYVSITGAPAATGTWTANARVSLIDPSNSVTILKDFGAADANPYNVQPDYTGAGGYQIRLEENSGNVATIAGATMHVVKNAAYSGHSCSPPRVPYSTTATIVTTNNKGVDGTVTWDATGCPSPNYHIIYGKGENLSAWTVDGGKSAIGTSGSYLWTGMPDPSGYASKFLWFLVVGDDGNKTEGSWGLMSNGAERGGTNCSNVCGMTSKVTAASCAIQ